MASFNIKKLIGEKTLGDKLKAYRKKKNLSLEQAEEETKVRARYLEALEKGTYSELPADVYVTGFLAKYADFLGAPKEELLTTFRRERGSGHLPRNIAPEIQLKEKRAYLTLKTVVLFLVALGLIVFLGYIFYAVRNFT